MHLDTAIACCNGLMCYYVELQFVKYNILSNNRTKEDFEILLINAVIAENVLYPTTT